MSSSEFEGMEKFYYVGVLPWANQDVLPPTDFIFWRFFFDLVIHEKDSVGVRDIVQEIFNLFLFCITNF